MCDETRGDDIVKNAVGALARLAQRRHRRVELIKAHALRPLPHLCYTVHNLAVLVVNVGVFSLAQDKSCQPHLLAEPLNICEDVLDSPGQRCDGQRAGHARTAAMDDRCLPDFEQTGLLTPLVRMLHTSNESMVTGRASEVLANIAAHALGHTIIEEANALPANCSVQRLSRCAGADQRDSCSY